MAQAYTTILQPTGDLTRSGHRLGNDTAEHMPLYIEEYGGEVETQIVKSSIMRQYVKMKSVRGTDTITNSRMGKTQLQKVIPGVRPEAHAPEFDNISIKVDTMVLARSNQHTLDDFQASFDVRAELGMDHGKEIAKFFDESILVQAIKCAQITDGDVNAPEGFLGGTKVTLGTAGDELDPDKLERAIQDACQLIEEKDVDIEGEGFAMFVAPAQYYALLRNDKLLDGDFSMGNGDYAKGKILMANGLRIIKTNRMPNVAHTGGEHHYLSNAGNNYAYDVTAADTKAVCAIFSPRALLAGETIPLTSKVHYSDVELQWFVDSYLAYGVTPNRPEFAAVVMKA